ncbi:hypothetical protein [Streptomyces ossamyceticus]|uniref:hypothetical protein n=1 Tax=Streptomyces ossamyceticus TaxID=249581 RepID=UPI00341CBFC4
MHNRLWTRLHRHGVARTLNSGSSNSHPNVTYLMEGRPWTPRWLIVRAANHNFRRTYPSRSASLYLAKVERHKVAMDGTRRWSLEYRPAGRDRA